VKALVLGGTFNPVHNGHLFLAEDARRALGFDTVILVPACIPVHKDPAPVADAAHRLAMLRLAVSGREGFLVEECEVRRGGPSYSIDTVRELVPRYRIEGRPGFLLGDDLAEGFGSWKEAASLAREARLILVRRGTGPAPHLAFPHECFANTLLTVSSSEIRRRAAEGRTIRFLLPDPVADYIERHRLYG
jgi:nicotinate-nucleotide adenylyltransferase